MSFYNNRVQVPYIPVFLFYMRNRSISNNLSINWSPIIWSENFNFQFLWGSLMVWCPDVKNLFRVIFKDFLPFEVKFKFLFSLQFFKFLKKLVNQSHRTLKLNKQRFYRNLRLRGLKYFLIFASFLKFKFLSLLSCL